MSYLAALPIPVNTGAYMFAWIAVGLGGALGSIARHGVNRIVHQHWPGLRFPLGTVVVNVIGCCIIGMLAGFVISGRLPMRFYWREFIFVGILGGFTTFSTFGLDTITLLRTGASGQAMLNIFIHLMGGLGGVYVGLVVCERLAGRVLR